MTLDAGVAQINSLVVAFPLLFLAGAAVLVVRLLALRPAPARAGRRAGCPRPGIWRPGGSPRRGWSAWSCWPRPPADRDAGLRRRPHPDLPVHPATKAGLINGAPRRAVVDPVRRNPATDAVGTLVYRYLYGKVADQTDDVTVLAIDPDTFPATAYWDRRFADRPARHPHGQAQRAPTAGRRRTGGRRRRGRPGVPARDVRARPGHHPDPDRDRRARHPLLRPARPRRRCSSSTAPASGRRPVRRAPDEMWSRDTTPDRARDAVTAQHARIYLMTSQDTVFEVANFLGVSWTFGYLSALAALVGLVAIGGLLLYLETRQRSRTASYALGRRMGLTRATHLRSLLAELGVLLGLAWAIGAGLAWAAVLIVYHRLDIDPTRPPAPLLTVPCSPSPAPPSPSRSSSCSPPSTPSGPPTAPTSRRCSALASRPVAEDPFPGSGRELARDPLRGRRLRGRGAVRRCRPRRRPYGQPRCRWNGISKTAANNRASTSGAGTARASVTQNPGSPGATCGAGHRAADHHDDRRVDQVEAVGERAEAPDRPGVQQPHQRPAGRWPPRPGAARSPAERQVDPEVVADRPHRAGARRSAPAPGGGERGQPVPRQPPDPVAGGDDAGADEAQREERRRTAGSAAISLSTADTCGASRPTATTGSGRPRRQHGHRAEPAQDSSSSGKTKYSWASTAIDQKAPFGHRRPDDVLQQQAVDDDRLAGGRRPSRGCGTTVQATIRLKPARPSTAAGSARRVGGRTGPSPPSRQPAGPARPPARSRTAR